MSASLLGQSRLDHVGWIAVQNLLFIIGMAQKNYIMKSTDR